MTLERRAAASSVGWGLFLASSWTWCIGMYLPVILLREWGWRSFWFFAVVNVVGATAVGWWWSRPASDRFTTERRWLLALFSLVTICFQVFFVSWMVGSSLQAPLVELLSAAGSSSVEVKLIPALSWLLASGTMLLGVAGVGAANGWRLLGVIASLGSLALWVAYGVPGMRLNDAGSAPPGEFWFIAPAIILGFLVCPHLDLSFHRVLQESRGHLAWIIFAAAFLPMLLFAASSGSPDGPIIAAPLVAWWFIQASFTAAVHSREIRRSGLPHSGGWILTAALVGAAAGSPLLAGEASYLRFLGLYGAVFPAVALLLWRGYRSLPILGYLALAIPCFEAGFLGSEGWWEPARSPSILSGQGGSRMAWAVTLPMILLIAMILPPRRRGGRTIPASNSQQGR